MSRRHNILSIPQGDTEVDRIDEVEVYRGAIQYRESHGVR
jgi:hypothetical protein